MNVKKSTHKINWTQKERETTREGERNEVDKQTMLRSPEYLHFIYSSFTYRYCCVRSRKPNNNKNHQNGKRPPFSRIGNWRKWNWKWTRWKSLLNRERERTSECTQSLLYGWWKGKIFSTPRRAQERVYNIKTATYSASASLIPFTMSILVSTAVVSKLSAGKMVIHGRHYKLQRPPQRYYLHWCGK